jgi:hypothetical protein
MKKRKKSVTLVRRKLNEKNQFRPSKLYEHLSYWFLLSFFKTSEEERFCTHRSWVNGEENAEVEVRPGALLPGSITDMGRS